MNHGESSRTETRSDLHICICENDYERSSRNCKAPYGGSIPPAASSCDNARELLRDEDGLGLPAEAYDRQLRRSDRISS